MCLCIVIGLGFVNDSLFASSSICFMHECPLHCTILTSAVTTPPRPPTPTPCFPGDREKGIGFFLVEFAIPFRTRM